MFLTFANGVQNGPIDESELRRRVSAGELSLDDKCYSFGWEKWVRIEEYLRSQSGNPNPVPENAEDWKIVHQRTDWTPTDTVPTDLDRLFARNQVPGVGFNDSGYGCWFLIIGIFVGAVAGTALGVSKDSSLPLLIAISAIPAGFAILYVLRKEKYESVLESVVHERKMNREREHESNERKAVENAIMDSHVCQEIILDVLPTQLASIEVLASKSKDLVGRAEVLFREGAFTPFWDSVDKTVGLLRSYDESIGEVRNLSIKYYGLLEGRKHNFPPFPSRGDDLPDLNPVFERLEAVIARAHRDFQFTQIYEQRKTTSAVLAGFASLNQAISHLREDIVDSIDGLRVSVDKGFQSVGQRIESFESSQNENAEALRNLLERQHQEFHSAEVERSDRDSRFQNRTGKSLDQIRKNTDPER
jgi:hypothetical protein